MTQSGELCKVFYYHGHLPSQTGISPRGETGVSYIGGLAMPHVFMRHGQSFYVYI